MILPTDAVEYRLFINLEKMIDLPELSNSFSQEQIMQNDGAQNNNVFEDLLDDHLSVGIRESEGL